MKKIAIQRKKSLSRIGHLESFALRVTHRKRQRVGNGTKSPCYTISCGCCDEKVEIYYDDDDVSLEINGVNGSLKNWREVLLPLLGIKEKDGEFVDVSKRAQSVRRTLLRMRKKYPKGAL